MTSYYKLNKKVLIDLNLKGKFLIEITKYRFIRSNMENSQIPDPPSWMTSTNIQPPWMISTGTSQSNFQPTCYYSANNWNTQNDTQPTQMYPHLNWSIPMNPTNSNIWSYHHNMIDNNDTFPNYLDRNYEPLSHPIMPPINNYPTPKPQTSVSPQYSNMNNYSRLSYNNTTPRNDNFHVSVNPLVIDEDIILLPSENTTIPADREEIVDICNAKRRNRQRILMESKRNIHVADRKTTAISKILDIINNEKDCRITTININITGNLRENELVQIKSLNSELGEYSHVKVNINKQLNH